MIKELSITNFKSFKDTATISFDLLGKYQKGNESQRKDKTQKLNIALIEDCDQESRDSITDAIAFLNSFWNRHPGSNSKGTGLQPFLSEETKGNYEFNLKFDIDGLLYWYCLRLDQGTIAREQLFVYKNAQQPTNVFTRNTSYEPKRIKFNQALMKLSTDDHRLLLNNCPHNVSILATLQRVSIPFPYLDKMLSWINSSWEPIIIGSSENKSDEGDC